MGSSSEYNINTFSNSNNVVLNLKNHHHNQLFNYKDAYEFMPYKVCESVTVEDIQIEIDRDQYCNNEIENTSIISNNLSTDENEINLENQSISFTQTQVME